MRTRKLIAIIIALSLNSGSATATQSLVNPPKQEQATISMTEKLMVKQKQDRLKKVVKYLLTKANKTAYVFSGSTTRGWDCSGLVVWAYKQTGITLPHSANKQGHLGKRVTKPQVGDIVVFAYPNRSDFYHAAIYVGNSKIINANYLYGTTVIQPLKDFAKSQIRFVRVFND
jgi:cell wall-associated NlpC family hydrolase